MGSPAGREVAARCSGGAPCPLGALPCPLAPATGLRAGFWLGGAAGIAVAAVVSLVAHVLVGAAKSLFTLRTWWAAGLEMTLAGVIVGGLTFGAGLLFHAG